MATQNKWEPLTRFTVYHIPILLNILLCVTCIITNINHRSFITYKFLYITTTKAQHRMSKVNGIGGKVSGIFFLIFLVAELISVTFLLSVSLSAHIPKIRLEAFSFDIYPGGWLA